MKKDFQTNLLGKMVWLNDRAYSDFHTIHSTEERGRIESVYMDGDGTPKYTVSVGGELYEMWSFYFRLQE